LLFWREVALDLAAGVVDGPRRLDLRFAEDASYSVNGTPGVRSCALHCNQYFLQLSRRVIHAQGELHLRLL
jgi:uncharacterized Fe-S cluster-containing radical SAM superfamily protein